MKAHVNDKGPYSLGLEAYEAKRRPIKPHTYKLGDMVTIEIPGHKLNLAVGTVINLRAAQILVKTEKWTKEFTVWVNSNEVRSV